MNLAERALTRYFIRHFLDVGFMTSSESSDGVRRAMLGAMSAVVTIGLFSPRLIGGKYFGIRAVADRYELTVLGDTLMLFAFAMLLVALAAALAGDSMFPDETDFRVLTPLPVTRGFVFAAKLRAVVLYLGVVIVIVSLALQVPFTAVSGGPHADAPWLVRAGVYSGASMIASLFAASAAMAAQGLIVLCAPRRYLRPMTVGTRTAILCGVVLLLPLAGRLPSQARAFTSASDFLYFVPPAWFVALERIALGTADRYSVQLGALALASLALTSAIVAGCYIVLYRRFDVLMLRASSAFQPRLRHRSDTAPTLLRHLSGTAPTLLRHRSDTCPTDINLARRQTAVISRFATKTLWRSPLQQVVFLGTTAIGLGWVLNGLLAGGLTSWLGGSAPSPRLVSAVTAMPFVLLLAGVTGLRGALMLPQDPRANWIFRLREDDDHRAAQLDAVERLFMRLVVMPVLVCTLPLQWGVLGADAFIALPVAYLLGIVLTEIVIRSWRRIPFTCGYIPGKRNVAQTFLMALTAYVFFTTAGRALVAVSRVHPSRFLIVFGFLMMIVAILRWHRLRTWGRFPLMFDDDPPEFAQPIQLR